MSVSGKDSTVLYHIIKNKMRLEVKKVFNNTGIEHVEIVRHIKSLKDVEVVSPEKNFLWVIRNKGIPVGSKKVARFIRDLQNDFGKNKATRNLRLTGYNRKGEFLPSMKLPKKWLKFVDSKWKVSEECCDILKKNPLRKWYRKNKLFPIIGNMASESNRREQDYLRFGCNIYSKRISISRPLSIWTEQDVLKYTVDNDIPLSRAYGKIVIKDGVYATTGEPRTGCMICLFGIHLDKEPNRLQRMKKYCPSMYKFCIETLGYGEICDFMGVPFE